MEARRYLAPRIPVTIPPTSSTAVARNISRPLVSWRASHQRREVTMIRLLTIPVTVAALAVTAAPASAGLLSSPLGVSASANGYLANHTEGTVSVTSKQLGGKARIVDGR